MLISDGWRAGWAAPLFVVGGLVVLLTEWAIPSHLHTGVLAGIAGSAVVTGLLVPLLPWERWPRRSLLVLPVLGHAMLAVAGLVVPGALDHYVALYVLCYVYIGVTQPPGTAASFAPLTALSLVVARLGGSIPLVSAVVVAAISVVVAELLAVVMQRHTAAQRGIAQLLSATRRIGSAASVEDATDALTVVAADLLGTDGNAVFVADAVGSDRFAIRTKDPSLAEFADMVVDISIEQSGVGTAVRSGQTVFIADAELSSIVSPRLVAQVGAKSMVFVPLIAPIGPVGAIVAWWHRPTRHLDPFARHGLELIAVEATRVLDALTAKERLIHEAGTDALTGLANRRTFQRALDAGAPGDAVVMLDLDHFKTVNDTHGHATGDDVLRSFADSLRDAARQADCVARIGGDEFAVVLSTGGLSGARRLIERLDQQWNRTDPLTSYSAGVAVRVDGEGPIAALGRADSELYNAKNNGRARVCFSAETVS